MNETTAAEEVVETTKNAVEEMNQFTACLLYTSDAADEL